MFRKFHYFQRKVAFSFKKAKADHEYLNKELGLLKTILAQQREEIQALRHQLTLFLNNQKKFVEDSSTGNKGVYSFIHSFNIHSPDTREDFSHFGEDLKKRFSTLSKQEFFTFLAIYQLEEDQKQVTYTDLATHLHLSEGCIRTYVSALFKKRIPLLKQKANNKLTFLSIPQEFRELNLKSFLVKIYAQFDPKQTQLSGLF